MGPTTDALLRSAGVRPGMRCLDLGCGAGHVSRCLAGHVGTTGSVLGLDFDNVKLESARSSCAESGLGNVEFRSEDVTTWREQETFDVAYGRFILSHLVDRPAFVRVLCRTLRPGGILILEDIDFTGCFCYPPNAAYTRYCELYHEVIGRRGGDANAGLQLYTMCLDAGLADVKVQLVQPLHTGLPEKGLSLSTLVNIGDAVVAEGLASAEELESTIAALTAFTDDPRSLVGVPRIFQVWGRRPTVPQ
jgi:SAM-dependent methyltransferase